MTHRRRIDTAGVADLDLGRLHPGSPLRDDPTGGSVLATQLLLLVGRASQLPYREVHGDQGPDILAGFLERGLGWFASANAPLIAITGGCELPLEALQRLERGGVDYRRVRTHRSVDLAAAEGVAAILERHAVAARQRGVAFSVDAWLAQRRATTAAPRRRISP
jgi:hypothetical protein